MGSVPLIRGDKKAFADAAACMATFFHSQSFVQQGTLELAHGR